MSRTILVYLAVLTFAEFSFTGRSAQAGDQNQVVYEPMKPVVADGKNVAPRIMDFTHDSEADSDSGKTKSKIKKLATAN